MLGSMHELAPSLVNFGVSWLYNKPILRRASCGNKTKMVTSRDLVIVVEPAFDQIKTSSWLNLYLEAAQLLIYGLNFWIKRHKQLCKDCELRLLD
jgi:hypothetical protein